MEQLKATTAQEIVRKEKDCDYMDELFGGIKMPPTQVYLKSDVDKLLADKRNFDIFTFTLDMDGDESDIEIIKEA